MKQMTEAHEKSEAARNEGGRRLSAEAEARIAEARARREEARRRFFEARERLYALNGRPRR
jgi:outer membrane protein TolC